MNGKDLLYILSEMDIELAQKAENPHSLRKKRGYLKYCALAACAVLVFAAATIRPDKPIPPDYPVVNWTATPDDPTVPLPSQDMEYKFFDPKDIPDFSNPGRYDNEFMGVTPAVSGPAESFEELTAEGTNSVDSLYRIRITYVLSHEEAKNLGGYSVSLGDNNATFYRGQVEYDYFRDEPIQRDIIFRMPGSIKMQIDGQPPFAEGDVIAAVLMAPDPDPGNEIIRLFKSYAFIYELVNVDGTEYAFVRGQSVPEAEAGLTDYAGGSFERITTTAKNPAKYCGAYNICELADNIRQLLSEDSVFDPDPLPIDPAVPTPPDPYILEVENAPVYHNVEIGFGAATGIPHSYEEYIEDYHIAGDALSFVRFTITGAYTQEEAYALTGDDAFDHSSSLFKAHISYDYLNQRDLDIDINLCHAGHKDYQINGSPIYGIGEEHVAYISNNGLNNFYVAMLDFAVYNVNGLDLAYLIAYDWDSFESKYVSGYYPNMNLEMAESERYIITTTDNNPVHYTRKMTLEDLIGFICEDWAARGFVFEGFTQPSADNSQNWSIRFTYHNVDIEILPISEFSAEPYEMRRYSYSDVAGELLAGKENLKFLEYEITEIESPEESKNQTGRSGGTLYHARVLNDLLTDSAESYDITLWHYGNDKNQILGYPVFSVGERFISVIYTDDNGVTRPIYELEFLVKECEYDSKIYAYHIGEDSVDIYAPEYGLEVGLGEGEFKYIGSTENNCYRFSQKCDPEVLAEFIRSDLRTRYSSPDSPTNAAPIE